MERLSVCGNRGYIGVTLGYIRDIEYAGLYRFRLQGLGFTKIGGCLRPALK